MNEGWRRTTLGDVVELKRGYDLPEQQRRPGAVPVVSSSGISGSHDEAKVKSPGVVTGRYGTIGEVFFLEQDFWPLNTTLYVCDFKGNDARFVSYFLRSVDYFAYSDKAAVPGVNRNHLHQAEVLWPPVEVQRQIAWVLGALDDKIALNRRTNETLEAMARALFRSWFVDFDPVRAKAEGRAPAGMDAATAALFPSSFSGSGAGQLPEGWSVTSLKNATSKIGSGATPRGGDRSYVDDGTAFIRSQNVYDSQFVWEGLARITDEAAEQLRGVTLQQGDVLINITGASILRTCIVAPDVLPARVSQHVAIVRAQPGIPPLFIHQHLLQPATKSFLLGMDAGGSRQAVTKGHLESVRLVLPDGRVLERFAEITDPILAAVTANNAQSSALERVRDALIPKLLSGELRVRGADGFVERVA